MTEKQVRTVLPTKDEPRAHRGRSTEFDDGGPDDFDIPGEGSAACAWTESLCVDSVTRFIVRVPVQEGIDPEIERYCDQHWVLKLAEIIETDMPICKHSLRDHVISTGELVGDTWEVRTEG
ncbi:hypothetical protein HMPREF1280_00910 [Propionibacterium sp. KPL1854]|nr:hypothetical protein HMPREF1280_00910 [Propionibacterium sp. KPL1854]